jgi:XK-related protein
MLLIQSYILMTMQSNDDSNINSIKIKTLGGQLSTHLVQQSTIVHQYQQKTFKDLNTISAFLSLFSVCWALASFSKNVRVHNVHRLVLTWLGVIFQFFWRLGTVTSRVLSLTAYASVYRKWIFLVISECSQFLALTFLLIIFIDFSSPLDFHVPVADFT